MNGNFKLMVKIIAGVFAVLALVYFTVPEAQSVISANGALLLLLLLCPLAMLIMALSMNKKSGDGRSASEPVNGLTEKSGNDDNTSR